MNTEFSYMYRDAANHKAAHSVIFTGTLSATQLEELRDTMDGREYFVADQVNLPSAFIYEDGEHKVTDADHGWHELVSISMTSEEATDEMREGGEPRCITDLLLAFKSASAEGWKPKAPTPTMVSTKFVGHVVVRDPDTGNACAVEIRKLHTGEMVGIDGAYLESLDGDPAVTGPANPYDPSMMLLIPADEVKTPQLQNPPRFECTECGSTALRLFSTGARVATPVTLNAAGKVSYGPARMGTSEMSYFACDGCGTPLKTSEELFVCDETELLSWLHARVPVKDRQVVVVGLQMVFKRSKQEAHAAETMARAIITLVNDRSARALVERDVALVWAPETTITETRC